MMGVAMAVKDEEFAVMLVVQYVAYSRPSELRNLTAGQVIRPLRESLPLCQLCISSILCRVRAKVTVQRNVFVELACFRGLQLFLRSQEESPAARARHPSGGRSQARYAVAFAKWAETSGVNVITTHPFSVRHGGASSDALWRTRSLMEIQKRGRWRSEKSVRRYEKHARLLKETSKLSTSTRKYGQLVISRMPRLLQGAQPPPSPVLTKLVRNRT